MKKSTMKNRPIPRRWRAFLVDQDGAIGIMIALLFPVLLGFAGLAIDMGHIYVVNTQLKNAADAGAKSGARALVPYTGVPLDLNWIAGRDKATATVLLNSADNKQLTDSTVTYGYWNFTTIPPSLQPAGIIPTANDFPAVSVTVSKTAGQNNGPVQMFLASVLGVLPADLSQTSVAMISFPEVVDQGFVKPLAITTDVINNYWNQPDGYKFKIGEPDNNQTEVNEAMWTSFTNPDNSAATVKDLMKPGNPTSLPVGENVYIYLPPGTMATLYSDKEDGIGQFKDQSIVLAVVDNLEHKTMVPIITFIAFHITDSSQGGKWVEGYFDKNYAIPPSQKASGIPPGESASIFTTPQLVN